MKYLNLFSIFTALVLLASCRTSDVALRHSKIHPAPSEHSINASRSEETTTLTTPNTPITQVQDASSLDQAETANSVAAVSTKTLQSFQNSPISAKPKIGHAKNAANQNSAARATANHKMLKQNGFVGNIGYSFGIVGLVFIIVGLVLFLVGGLIIDTLAAVAIAFGFVFILIWLVLAILQGLFDVIL
jgi:hypothetical protein